MISTAPFWKVVCFGRRQKTCRARSFSPGSRLLLQMLSPPWEQLKKIWKKKPSRPQQKPVSHILIHSLVLQYIVNNFLGPPTCHSCEIYCRLRPWITAHILLWSRRPCESREQSVKSRFGLKGKNQAVSWTCKSRGMWESSQCSVQNNRPLSGFCRPAWHISVESVKWVSSLQGRTSTRSRDVCLTTPTLPKDRYKGVLFFFYWFCFGFILLFCEKVPFRVFSQWPHSLYAHVHIYLIYNQSVWLFFKLSIYSHCMKCASNGDPWIDYINQTCANWFNEQLLRFWSSLLRRSIIKASHPRLLFVGAHACGCRHVSGHPAVWDRNPARALCPGTLPRWWCHPDAHR